MQASDQTIRDIMDHLKLTEAEAREVADDACCNEELRAAAGQMYEAGGDFYPIGDTQ